MLTPLLCRQRRIKCDEKRPQCSNCIRSKKQCTGYPPPPRRTGHFDEIRIAPKPIVASSAPPPGREPIQLTPRRAAKNYQRRTTPPQTPRDTQAVLILHRPPSIDLPFSDQEALYFQQFRENTASELSGFFDSAFWARTVLQECHAEASIRYAVVALGALYKTLEKNSESPPSSPSNAVLDPSDQAQRHWEMAVRQYSNACISLAAVNSSDTRSNRTRLIASVLLACFDSFVGDHKLAIRQIQNGLGLLEQLRVEKRQDFTATSDEPVEDELVQMFTRLAIQAKSYDMAFHFPDPFVVRLTNNGPQSQEPGSPISEPASTPGSATYQGQIPDRFTSVMEARVAWDKLTKRIFMFRESMFDQAQSGVMGVLPANLRHFGMRFKQEMEDWIAAFDPILHSRTAPGVSSQEKAGIAVLKMTTIMTQILFLMTFSDTEMQFDAFIPQFKQIVDLALEVIGDEERRAAAKRCPDPMFCRHQAGHEPDIFGGYEYATRHIKPSFSADLGIVPPLFVVATKCRDPLIRRQAIQLLRSSSRREGMWDSELTARIAMWITSIEEEELAQYPLTPGHSPVQGHSRPSTSGTSMNRANGSSNGIDFGDAALGPGGNARWDSRRESVSTTVSGGMHGGRSPMQQHQQLQRKVVPEDKRVMVRAVDFNLRERTAVVQLGTRGLRTGTPDLRTRVTEIHW